MRWQILSILAAIFSVAAVVGTFNDDSLDRVADAVSVLPAVLLACAAGIARAIEKRNE